MLSHAWKEVRGISGNMNALSLFISQAKIESPLKKYKIPPP
jgi:hypothetical protein